MVVVHAEGPVGAEGGEGGRRRGQGMHPQHPVAGPRQQVLPRATVGGEDHMTSHDVT